MELNETTYREALAGFAQRPPKTFFHGGRSAIDQAQLDFVFMSNDVDTKPWRPAPPVEAPKPPPVIDNKHMEKKRLFAEAQERGLKPVWAGSTVETLTKLIADHDAAQTKTDQKRLSADEKRAELLAMSDDDLQGLGVAAGIESDNLSREDLVEKLVGQV